MRIDGVGSGMVHTADSHQVTECVHQHGTEKKPENGGFRGIPVNVEKRDPVQELTEKSSTEVDQGWFSRILATGKNLLGRLWNGGKEGEQSSREYVDETGDEARAALEKGMTMGGESQSFREQSERRQAVHNPYFVAVEERKGADTLWQRFQLKVQTATGYLAKKFGRNTSFQTGTRGRNQRQKEEDLRRHSRYHQGQDEIDCIITDDSYLLDSYDKSGKYSRLAQESGAGGQKKDN